jgi:hypothetical protein
MIKSLLAVANGIVLIATAPALAQSRGPGGGLRGGPPIISPRGDSLGVADIARELEPLRGQFDRDFADKQPASAEERRLQPQERRASALVLARAARNGAPIPASAAARIREALRQDIDAWRAEFDVGRREWQAMRDEWLVARHSLTAGEWALHRAAWFEARDAWIARPQALASVRPR